MKKRLNIEMISNELSGASLFFQRSAQTTGATDVAGRQHPAVPHQEERDDRPATSDAQTPAGAAYVRTDVRRRLTRTPFEFYQDQLERLRALSLAAKLRGEKGSMSAMVRAAIDRYLAEGEEEVPTG